MTETPPRTSFELFVGRHLSPATLATFPVPLMPTAVPRNTVHRLRVGAGSDIAEILGRLTARDVEVLEIRRCPQDPAGLPRPRTAWTVPPESDRSDVVVQLPVRPPASDDAADDGRVAAGVSVLRPDRGRRDGAGRRRGRRPLRRGGRG